jgi:hypothetical protein
LYLYVSKKREDIHVGKGEGVLRGGCGGREEGEGETNVTSVSDVKDDYT